MDEIRISDGVQRSADWELTEYNKAINIVF